MTSRSASNNSKSVKTFVIYAGIVLFFIVLSLAIKSFFIIQQSRFDGKHEFILAIAQKKQVKELVLFDPSERSVTLVRLKGQELALSALSKRLSVIPDAQVTTSSELPLANIADTMRTIVFTYPSFTTDLTFFDALGLLFVSQKASINNQQRNSTNNRI